jgi:mono/diheme cytochrome c family protein
LSIKIYEVLVIYSTKIIFCGFLLTNLSIMKKFLKILAIAGIVIIVAIAGLLVYVKTALPNVGPPPDLKVELTPERVKHGEYLANHVTVCIDCHSQRDFSVWSGPVVPGTFGQGGEGFTQDMGFPGKFYAKNLTPEHLSGWTDGEIFRAVTTGVNKDGKALFSIMPWQHYGKMDPEDIKDVIAYIRTLKPIKNEPPVSVPDFPMNFILNTLPAKQEPGKRPDKSDLLAYGGYMVNAAGCSECHTKSEKGKVVGEPFAGGFEFKLQSGLLRSANITPDKDNGIGNLSEADFLQKFKNYTDSSYVPKKINPGEMQTVMPWTMFAGMDSADLKAIYHYLRTVKPVGKPIVKWEPNADVTKM